MAKLTKLQVETLRRIRAGTVSMRNCGHAAFRTFGATGSVVGRLVSIGLAVWPEGAIGEQTCQITPAGLAALEGEEGK